MAKKAINKKKMEDCCKNMGGEYCKGEVMKDAASQLGDNHKYLGHFTQKKFMDQGHNLSGMIQPEVYAAIDSSPSEQPDMNPAAARSVVSDVSPSMETVRERKMREALERTKKQVELDKLMEESYGEKAREREFHRNKLKKSLK